MLVPILYLVVLSAVSLSVVAFFLTYPRERRDPAPHGTPQSHSRRRAEAGGKPRRPAVTGATERVRGRAEDG